MGRNGFRTNPKPIWFFLALMILASQVVLPLAGSREAFPISSWDLFSNVSRNRSFFELELPAVAKRPASKRIFYLTQSLGLELIKKDPSMSLIADRARRLEQVLQSQVSTTSYRIYLSQVDVGDFLRSGAVRRGRLVYESEPQP